MRLWSLPAAMFVALLSVPASADFKPTPIPVSPDGVTATVDLPPNQHIQNTGGLGPRGPGTGAGLCVFSSCEVAERRWQNGLLAGFQSWMQSRPGGGDPRKLQQMITAFCKEKGVKEPDYVQHTGGDVTFIEEALKTRRAVCVTYAGADDFYAGGIDHMVVCAHLDKERAAILDNNRPSRTVWMTRKEFEIRWRARGGGWAVVFLNSPPPPVATRLQIQGLDYPTRTYEIEQPAPCICGDSCSCAKGNCPAKCPVALQQQRTCPNGRCSTASTTYYVVPPAPAQQPSPITATAVQWVDRSESSVQVAREVAADRTELGTGTVVAARSGESLILTNAHVAEDGTKPLSIRTQGGRSYPAKYVAGSRVEHIDSENIRVHGPDLALVSVAAELPVAPVASDTPVEGTAVCLWGYGKVTDGRPAQKTGRTLPQGDYVGSIQLTSIPSQNGDSGSGVFNEKGALVAVGWGGGRGTQFCVRLDAVRVFLNPHLKGFGQLGPVVVAAAAVPEPEGENHGINRAELDELTKGGKRTYWVNGREVGRPQALDVVSTGGLGLVDDSDRYHLSIVSYSPSTVKAVLADPKLTTLLGKVHVQVYSPTDWVAKDRLKAPVTLQEPSPKGGKVIWTADVIDAATLAEGLKRTDPNWKPESPAPRMPDPVPPVAPDTKPQPVPAPNPAPQPDPVPAPPANPSAPTPLLVLIGLVVLYLFLPRKTN